MFLQLSEGGKAANANVGIGDVVLTIDGISADGMTHLEAQNKIKTCSGNLTMNLQRAPAAPKPDPIPVQQVEPKELVKPVPIASAVVPKVSSTGNVAFNKAPRPFGAVSSSKVTSIPSPSSAFTPAHSSFSSRASPTPLATVTPPPFTASGLHANAKPNADQRSPVLSAAKPAVNAPWQPPHTASLNTPFNENAPEVAEGQRRGFKENQGDSKQQNGNSDEVPPRKHIVYTNTEFYHPPLHSNNSKKRLIEDTEDWHPRTGTTQSRSFRILAQITGTEHMKEPEPENTKKTKESQTENGDLRELFYNNPLEALPKGAPHPPAAVRILSGSSQVAVFSKTAKTYTRSNKIRTGSLDLNAQVPLRLAANEVESKRSPPTLSTVATQTTELLVFPAAPVESALSVQPAKPTLVPPPSGRLSDHNTYRSLLDALLITPIIKPPPMESGRPSRKSTSVLEMQRNWTL
ncbi:PDZ and LIM domain protein 5 [Varanus komodoensis]|nr:PDZ and LIM domain protein 5 [Varanus komodoensis]